MTHNCRSPWHRRCSFVLWGLRARSTQAPGGGGLLRHARGRACFMVLVCATMKRGQKSSEFTRRRPRSVCVCVCVWRRAYSIPLWQCFLRNWKRFLTTFSTSLKGCWICALTRGVTWTTPTSTCRRRGGHTHFRGRGGEGTKAGGEGGEDGERGGGIKDKEQAEDKMTQHGCLTRCSGCHGNTCATDRGSGGPVRPSVPLQLRPFIPFSLRLSADRL